MMMKVKMIFSAKAAQHEHDLGGSQKGILMGLRAGGVFGRLLKKGRPQPYLA